VERLPGLGCRAEGQRSEVSLIWCHAVKARVWPPAVIKVEVSLACVGGGDVTSAPGRAVLHASAGIVSQFEICDLAPFMKC